MAGAHGRDGAALVGEAGDRLDQLSELAGRLGVDDPVEAYLTPVVGRWSDLHDEAERWRTAARAAEDVTHRLTSPLGGLDAAWQGQDATSFLDYMRRVGLAGNDLSDAMHAMADALDKTADGIREIVRELVDVLADTADQAADAVHRTGSVAGHARAKDLLSELDGPTSRLHASVGDVLRAFTKLCDNVHGGQAFTAITVSHAMPAQNWAPQPQPPAPVATPPAPPPATPVPHVAQPATVAHPATPAAAPIAHPAAAPSPAAPSHAAAAHAAAATTPPPAAQPAPQLGPPAESAAVPDPTTGSMSGQLPVAGPAAGADAGPGQAGAPGGMGGMGMMGGMGGMRGQGGDQQHKAKVPLSGDVRDLLGKPDPTAPPTIGG